MTLENKLRDMAGKVVSDKSIAGNTIEVWLDVPRRSDQAIVFGVDAPWRIVGPCGIVTTSADLPWDMNRDESEADYKIRNEEAWAKSDFLKGLILQSASVDQKTGDLTLQFTGGFTLQSFTVWMDEPPWSLRLYAENRRLGPALDKPIKPPRRSAIHP